jgi:hypothetical protein
MKTWEDSKMRAKNTLLGAAAIAAFLIPAYSTNALAILCAATDIEPARPCAMNEGISVIVESHPITAVYNLVDNSINFSERSNTKSGSMSTTIESSPTTTIDNLVSNAINLQVSETKGVPIDIFIESNPVTLIYNLINNSISFLEVNGAYDTLINSLIESTPSTTIYNVVDNSINIAVMSANGQDDLASSVAAAAPEPASLDLLGIALGALSFVCIRRRTRRSPDRIRASLSVEEPEPVVYLRAVMSTR